MARKRVNKIKNEELDTYNDLLEKTSILEKKHPKVSKMLFEIVINNYQKTRENLEKDDISINSNKCFILFMYLMQLTIYDNQVEKGKVKAGTFELIN